jgi:hypothetical protein
MFAEVNSSLSSQQDTSKIATYTTHIITAIVVLIAVPLFYTHQYSIHHDLAGSMLSGKFATELGYTYGQYGIYFPPAEKVWFSLAAVLHTITGIRLDTIVVIMTGIAILLSTQFAYFIRRKTVGATPLFLLMSVTALVVLPIAFKNVFGLREHLVALGIWPYLVYRLSDPTGIALSSKWRIVMGVWLGWTLLFKYLYAFVVLFIELTDAIIQRRLSNLFRMENLISGSIVAVYIFVWLILQPQNLQTIGIMKNAIQANIISFQQTAQYIGVYLLSGIPLIAAGFIYKSNKRSLLIGLALLLSAILVTAIQARWYSHHQFPIFIATLVLLWIIQSKTPKMVSLFVCLFLMNTVYGQFKENSLYQARFKLLDQSFLANNISLENKRVGLMIAHPSPFSEIVAQHGGTRWTALVNFAHVFSELEKADIIENEGKLAPPIERFIDGREILHDKTMSLWEDFPPDVIIMDHSNSWPLKHLEVNWPHLFSKDERFAKIMANYALAYSHEEKYLGYDYYIKKQ